MNAPSYQFLQVMFFIKELTSISTCTHVFDWYFHTTSTLMPPSSIRVFLVSLGGFSVLIGILPSFSSYVWCFSEFFQCCSMSLNVSLVLLNVYQCFPNVPSSLSRIIILLLIILHISQYFVNVAWHPWDHPNVVRGSLASSWCCLASLGVFQCFSDKIPKKQNS